MGESLEKKMLVGKTRYSNLDAKFLEFKKSNWRTHFSSCILGYLCLNL